MIEAIVGSVGAERVLLYLEARGCGYANEIADFYLTDVSTIQNQLKRLEREGLLVSSLLGKTRIYRFHPGYYFLPELKPLLHRALTSASPEIRNALMTGARRPGLI